MKIAICISGIARGNITRNIEHLKLAFDGDLFFSTWKEHENRMSSFYQSKLYPEPEVHYNPWNECEQPCDIHRYLFYKREFDNVTPLSKQPKWLNATKQIIAHAYQVEDLPAKYDMIVRVRWDTFVSKKTDFKNYIQDSYDNKRAIGFAIRGSRWPDVHKFFDIPHTYHADDGPSTFGPNSPLSSRDWQGYLNDNLILHPRELLDTQMIHKLHKEKKLLPAEFGWHQVLSKNDNHHCVYGGACIERYVTT